MAREISLPAGGFARIRSAYPSLTPTEKKVADYCLEKPEDHLSFMPNWVSAAVGEATIIRFPSGGFSGYQALKLNSLRIGQQQEAAQAVPNRGSSMETLIEITAMNASALTTSQMVRPAALEKAVEAIIKAKNMFLWGWVPRAQPLMPKASFENRHDCPRPCRAIIKLWHWPISAKKTCVLVSPTPAAPRTLWTACAWPRKTAPSPSP